MLTVRALDTQHVMKRANNDAGIKTRRYHDTPQVWLRPRKGPHSWKSGVAKNVLPERKVFIDQALRLYRAHPCTTSFRAIDKLI